MVSRVKAKKLIIIWAVLAGCLFLFSGFIKGKGYRLTFSESESLGTALFWVKPNEGDNVRGQYVMFHTNPNPYANAVAIKRIAGVAGDEVNIIDGNVYVNTTLVGFAKLQTKTGKPLTAIKFDRIPDGFIFVMGEHKDSFDSRYEEFGLIDVRNVQGIASEVF